MSHWALLLVILLPLSAQSQRQNPLIGQVIPDYYEGFGPLESLWVKEVTLLSMKYVGSGLKSNRTGESFAFVCVGQPRAAGQGPECDFARPAYWNPQTRRAFVFGDTWHLYPREQADEMVLTRKYLRTYFKDYMNGLTQHNGRREYKNRSVMSLKKASGSVTWQKDWNWASNPIGIDDRKWLRLMNELNGGHLLAPAHVLDWTLSKPDTDPSSMRKYPLNPHMIRKYPNSKDR